VPEEPTEGIAVREWGDPGQAGILLWPGLGSTAAYFSALAPLLPGRVLAADPPGFGRSPPPDVYSYEGLVDAARAVIVEHGCQALVGHSLGADLALGVAAEPPDGLKAVVLIDGGYLDAATRGALGLPTDASRADLTAWMAENSPRFPDWDTAIREIGAMWEAAATPEVEEAVRDAFVEVGGEVRQAAPPDRLADLLLAFLHEDIDDRARGTKMPTLLIACGQPRERAAIKRPAWEVFAQASPVIELRVADEWGHNPPLQDAAGTARMIAEWLGPYLAKEAGRLDVGAA
jgi:pimeloyl-ACP methyl ester carboxylesterase